MRTLCENLGRFLCGYPIFGLATLSVLATITLAVSGHNLRMVAVFAISGIILTLWGLIQANTADTDNSEQF